MPSEAPVLGFDRISEAMSGIITSSDPRFAIGIFGGWGSGKTTLMSALARRVEDEGAIVVPFNAWRYEREAHLIVPLLDTLRERLVAWSENRSDKGERNAAKRAAGTIGRVSRSMVAGLSLTVGLLGSVEASFSVLDALAEGERLRKEDAVKPGSFYHASFLALRRAFADFIGETEARQRIVVFVDDLDRCLPENALQVLESMKLFFDLPGFVFVVGLDHDVIEQVVETKYGKGEAGLPSVRGSEYVKKIFQLPYRLPVLARGQVDAFLESAYAEASLDEAQQRDLQENVVPHLDYFLSRSANPREIKRFFNSYIVQRAIEPSLEPAVVVTLQVTAFRRDWRVPDEAISEHRQEFVAALSQALLKDEMAPLRALESELGQVPDEFLEYVGPDRPGHALLQVDDIAPYLSSSESVRSTQDSRLMEALHSAATIRARLRSMDGRRLMSAEAAPLLQALDDLAPTLRRASERAWLLGRDLYRAIQEDVEPPVVADDRRAKVYSLADDLVRAVRRAYRAGDLSGDTSV